MTPLRKRPIIVCLTCLLVLSLLGASAYVFIPTGRPIHGMYLEDQSIAGLNSEALQYEIDRLSHDKGLTINLITPQGSQTLRLEDLGVRADPDKTYEAIMAYGYETSPLQYLRNRLLALIYPVHKDLVFTVDQPIAYDYLEKLSKSMLLNGHDAYLSLSPQGQVILHPEKAGQVVNVQALVDQLVSQADQGDLNQLHMDIQEESSYKVTAKDLEGLTSLLASYQSAFDPSATGRSHNIDIASAKITGTLVGPGQTFSFNDVVGERTAEAGFDDAPVMIDGKLVPGIGGGICQVSSTLFNAALESGMEIVERTPHFEPVGYIPKGRDATVAWGYLDFQFKNPYSHPIYILSTIDNGTLSIYIIGSPTDKPRQVSISVGNERILPHGSQTKFDQNLVGDRIEEGTDGLEVTTWRHIVRADGQAYDDSFQSIYDPQDTIIIKGRSK